MDRLDALAAAVEAEPAVPRPTVAPDRPSQQALDVPASRQRPKEPSKAAIAVYRYRLVTGKSQTELAQDPDLMKQLRRAVDQGTISRWLNQVKRWIEAGNVLPDLTVTPDTKPTPMDPEQIDLGERQDGRSKRQRGRRNSDRSD
jgi:hypothetical protein